MELDPYDGDAESPTSSPVKRRERDWDNHGSRDCLVDIFKRVKIQVTPGEIRFVCFVIYFGAIFQIGILSRLKNEVRKIHLKFPFVRIEERSATGIELRVEIRGRVGIYYLDITKYYPHNSPSLFLLRDSDDPDSKVPVFLPILTQWSPLFGIDDIVHSLLSLEPQTV